MSALATSAGRGCRRSPRLDRSCRLCRVRRRGLEERGEARGGLTPRRLDLRLAPRPLLLRLEVVEQKSEAVVVVEAAEEEAVVAAMAVSTKAQLQGVP